MRGLEWLSSGTLERVWIRTPDGQGCRAVGVDGCACTEAQTRVIAGVPYAPTVAPAVTRPPGLGRWRWNKARKRDAEQTFVPPCESRRRCDTGRVFAPTAQ